MFKKDRRQYQIPGGTTEGAKPCYFKSRASNQKFGKYICCSNTFTFAMIPGHGWYNSILSTGPSVWNSPQLPPRFILSLGSPPPASYPLSHVSHGNGSDVGRGWDWGHSQQVEPAPVNRPGFKLSTLETAGTKVGGQYTAHLGPWKPNLWRAWLISIQIAAYDSMLSTSGQTM